jgi:hypothetical protein
MGKNKGPIKSSMPLLQDLIDSRMKEEEIKHNNFSSKAAITEFKSDNDYVSKFIRKTFNQINAAPKKIWQPSKFNPARSEALVSINLK